MAVKLYDLNVQRLMIGGLRIGGFSEQDAVSIQWDDVLVNKTTTADGRKNYSRTNDPGVMVVVHLMNTSLSYQNLWDFMAVQHGLNLPRGAAPTRIDPLPFRLYDPIIGDLISDAYTIFEDRPAPQKGKVVGAVQFPISLPNPTVDFGRLNLL